MLGTLHTRDDARFELRFERRLAHPVEKVWRAITEADHLREWFPAYVDIEPQPGATLRFGLRPEAKQRNDIPDELMTSYGEVTAVDPPRLLEYTWAGETLRWELEPVEDGCRLRFTNVFDDRDIAAGDGAGWHAALDGLEAALAGRPLDRMALYDRADELGEPYAQAMGLAPGGVDWRISVVEWRRSVRARGRPCRGRAPRVRGPARRPPRRAGTSGRRVPAADPRRTTRPAGRAARRPAGRRRSARRRS